MVAYSKTQCNSNYCLDLDSKEKMGNSVSEVKLNKQHWIFEKMHF